MSRGQMALWMTDFLTNGVATVCAQHNLPIIAYAPLPHSALSNQAMKKNSDLADDDWRKHLPKF